MADILTKAAFTQKAIVTLRRDKYKGIHNVFSGFNTAARKYFSLEAEWDKGTNPKGVIALLNTLVEEGVIETRPGNKGFMIYLKGEMPEGSSPVDVLAKMGL